MVSALRSLRDDGVECEVVLAGDGTWRKTVENSIAKARLGQRVTITGWVNGEEVKRQIEGARALVLPSFSENMPVVIMEALALGRPVISTYVAGIRELVHPGKDGWLVPAGDVAALAYAMREALWTPAERLTGMGEAGRECINENHHSCKEAMKLMEFF